MKPRTLAQRATLAALVLLPAQLQAQDADPTQLAVAVERLDGARESVRVALTTSIPVVAIGHPAAREIIVRYSEPIDGAPLEDLPMQLTDWVAGVQYGYDSVLIVFTRPVEVDVRSAPDGLQLTMTPADTTPDDPQAGDDDGVQTALLRTRYLAQTGEAVQALSELDALASRAPPNADVLATRGDINRQTGRWIEALADYDRALGVRPDSEFFQESRRDLLNTQRPYVRSRLDWRVAGNDDNRIRLFNEGRDYLRERLETRLSTQSEFARIDNVRREDGTLRDFDGVRHRAALDVRYHRLTGDKVSALLFASHGGVGGGAAYEWVEPDAQTRFEAVVLEPAWNLTESFVLGGTVDRLAVARQQRLGGLDLGRLDVGGGLGIGNYRLDLKSRAQSLNASAFATYTVRAERPNLAVTYAIDTEYPLSVDETTVAGVTFEPLPVERREVHTLTLSGAHRFETDVDVQAGASYAVDRFGNAGPGGFLNVIVPIGRDWLLSAGVSYAADLSDGGTSVTIAGIEVRWRYAETPADGLRRFLD